MIFVLCLTPAGIDAAYVPAGTAVAPTNFTPADGCDIARARINITSTTTIVNALASNYVRIYGLFLRVGSAAANSVTIESTGGTDLLGGLYDFTAKESLFLPQGPNIYDLTPISEGLVLTLSGAEEVVGMLYYTQCDTAP
jgi:hypothetical protein